MNDETKIVDFGGDYKDVSGLLEEDRSKIDDKVTIGDKIEIIKPIIPIKPIRAPKFAAMRSMAEYPIPTPVTRKEMFLNVIAGGISELPTPKTREELYLAKICGQDVEIPIPLTRYEMYLYALSGGEWEVPEPVTRLEIFLYHNCGYEIEVPEPITREEIYWNGGQPQPTTIEGIPPLTFTAKRTGTLEDYTIWGNSLQTGTPTPDSPIEPEFCGDLVSIELDEPLRAVGDYKDTLDLGTKTYTKGIRECILTGEEGWGRQGSETNPTFYMSVGRQYYTVSGSLTNDAIVKGNPVFGYSSRVYVDYGNHTSEYTVETLKTYLREQYTNGTPVKLYYAYANPPEPTVISDIPDGMIGNIEGYAERTEEPTEGHQVDYSFNGKLLPNDKYQVYKTYKIPISSAGQTKNIYLSEPLRKIDEYADELNYASRTVTRRIKTFIYDGTEGWNRSSLGDGAAYLVPSPPIISRTQMICTHFPWVRNTDGAQPPCCHSDGSIRLWKEVGISIPDFKAWLAEQYANGNPVKISVILKTPVTEQITLPEIPTLKKPNTTVIDVETEVEPSEVDVTYRGSTKPQYDLFLAQNGDSFEAQDGQSLYIGGDV